MVWYSFRCCENAQLTGEVDLSADDSRAKILVVATNEELIVSRETARVLKECVENTPTIVLVENGFSRCAVADGLHQIFSSSENSDGEPEQYCRQYEDYEECYHAGGGDVPKNPLRSLRGSL